MSTRSTTRPVALAARFWLPVVVYVALIAVVSHQPDLAPPVPYLFFVELDKVAHAVEYAGLGLLLARAWRATLRDASPLTRGLLTIACGVALGAIDEYHQSFVPGRDASGWDLVADGAGATLATLVYQAWVRS